MDQLIYQFMGTSYSKYDRVLYRNHYLMYIFNGTKAYFDALQEHSTDFKHIVCMFKEVNPENSLANSCWKDLQKLELQEDKRH